MCRESFYPEKSSVGGERMVLASVGRTEPLTSLGLTSLLLGLVEGCTE